MSILLAKLKNTRYLELCYPQLCSLGREAARLNLYERSPDCRHYCLYSQRQSTAMAWESTTVKILSPGSFEPLLHANICTHALWRECGTSPWILICFCMSEIQRSETGSGGEEQSSVSHICLSAISQWGFSSAAHWGQREFAHCFQGSHTTTKISKMSTSNQESKSIPSKQLEFNCCSCIKFWPWSTCAQVFRKWFQLFKWAATTTMM